MASITIIILGFIAGMLTMTIISFYKWFMNTLNK
jgi:hypothetical protein